MNVLEPLPVASKESVDLCEASLVASKESGDLGEASPVASKESEDSGEALHVASAESVVLGEESPGSYLLFVCCSFLLLISASLSTFCSLLALH